MSALFVPWNWKTTIALAFCAANNWPVKSEPWMSISTAPANPTVADASFGGEIVMALPLPTVPCVQLTPFRPCWNALDAVDWSLYVESSSWKNNVPSLFVAADPTSITGGNCVAVLG